MENQIAHPENGKNSGWKPQNMECVKVGCKGSYENPVIPHFLHRTASDLSAKQTALVAVFVRAGETKMWTLLQKTEVILEDTKKRQDMKPKWTGKNAGGIR